MTAGCEAYVASQFDRQAARFRSDVEPGDFRLAGLQRVLGPLPGQRILDLGCGQGRFARRLEALGAKVVGIDGSLGMLERGAGLARVHGTARMLPFADGTFDSVIAIEVLEHVGPDLEAVLSEAARVLLPGGRLAVIDKNATALDARRPWLPALAVKWLDEQRGLWMYPAGAPYRERWFRPARLARLLGTWLDDVRIDHLRSDLEARQPVFARSPERRLHVLWSGRARGGRA